MAGPVATPEQALAAALENAAAQGHEIQRLVVSFSGGADSTALLAAAATLTARTGIALEAIHFDHNWQAASASWAAHCAQLAASLGVSLQIETFQERAPPGTSLEAFGRELRYAALAVQARYGTAVLTAHHAEDLAETFLLMALRGSGPHGLAAIAALRRLGAGLLLRPFLALGKAELIAYNTSRGLPTLEDPTNRSEAFDRNYLRHRILPALRARWPGTDATLHRAARLQQQAAEALDEAAERALVAGGATDLRMPLKMRTQVSPALWRWCVRRWLVRHGAPLPSAVAIDRICDELPLAAPDRLPEVRWPGATVRRYDGALWLTADDCATLEGEWWWSPEIALRLPGGWLRATREAGQGLAVSALAGQRLRVAARQGGERLRLPGRLHHHRLKHLWQAARVPPWERNRTPLLYLADVLVAVPGLAVDAAVAATAGVPGWVFHWHPDLFAGRREDPG